MVNQVTLVGRLGKDPEVKTFQDGNQVCKLSVATSERYQDKSGEWQELTEWHTVVVWGKAAGYIPDKYHKGDKVFVNGKITYRYYKDQSGDKKYFTEIVGRQIKMMEKRDGNNSGNYQNQYYNPENTHQTNTESNEVKQSMGENDDLPF